MPRTARTARKPAPKTARMIAEETLRACFEAFVATPNTTNTVRLTAAQIEYRDATVAELFEGARLVVVDDA